MAHSVVRRWWAAARRAAVLPSRSEETYKQLFERHPAPMFVFDPETLRFVAVNDAAVATYGYTRDEFLAMTIEDIRPHDDRGKVREAVSDPDRGRVPPAAWRHVRKDGTVIDVAVSSNDIEFDGKPARLVLAEDVTETGNLQRQLRQMYKMDAVGQLAGGIAHDFNNLLTAIGGFSSLALESLPADAPAAANVRQVQLAAERAGDLTRQLLAYARQSAQQTISLDLNRVVRESEALLSRVIGEHIVIVTELADSLGLVLADDGQLSQVLMNLAVNARDAMLDGGTVTIRTRDAKLDDAAAARLWGAPPGHYVVLEVTDTGTGMDEETRDHIFEPFFTTKPAGHGTGLGLSTVFGIVKQSGGYIKVDSAIGAGTTFTIYLPRDETAGGMRQTGGETVLVVEDEPVVRSLLEKLLTAGGYVVLPAADAAEALQLIGEHDVDAVVVDVMLPSMRGPALVEQLRRHRPQLRALFTSGDTKDEVVARGVGEGEVAFVEKPFAPRELTVRLRQLLDTY